MISNPQTDPPWAYDQSECEHAQAYCISTVIRQYRGAGIDLLINGDRNDGETRELFASDVMPHFA